MREEDFVTGTTGCAAPISWRWEQSWERAAHVLETGSPHMELKAFWNLAETQVCTNVFIHVSIA